MIIARIPYAYERNLELKIRHMLFDSRNINGQRISMEKIKQYFAVLEDYQALRPESPIRGRHTEDEIAQAYSRLTSAVVL